MKKLYIAPELIDILPCEAMCETVSLVKAGKAGENQIQVAGSRDFFGDEDE